MLYVTDIISPHMRARKQKHDIGHIASNKIYPEHVEMLVPAKRVSSI